MINSSTTETQEARGRAGALALSLLAAPCNATLLLDLADGPRSLADLRRTAGSPPQTTMRGHLRELAGVGVVEKRSQNGFHGSVDYQLTAAGRELLSVAGMLEAWLGSSPEEPIAFAGDIAKSAIKALVGGWTVGMVRALASRHLSLTELNRVIADVSYPALERRLVAMRLNGLVEAAPGRDRSTPYAVTEWLRAAVVPIAAAARWERRRLRERAPAITNRDIEAAFLLVLPLLSLPAEASGSCRLAVRMGNESRAGAAGVIALVRQGVVAVADTKLDQDAEAWVVGQPAAWFAAVLDGDDANLEFGGETGLATELVERLHG